ncbi:FecR family protein [Sphingopyxis sp. MWB1]|uniref:FecR family protein n=1 Tax=Sphingopyxis sp. MWB1 TaxID=1537715 RepID=UPI00051A7E67|nr:FecR domain-containing protein [Sphingopyxis sp. MWB1]
MTETSPDPNRRETASQIDDAAATWAAKVDRGPLNDKEQALLDTWLSGDSRRLGAYARALAINAHYDRAAALGPGYAPTNFEEAERAPALARRKFLVAGGGAIAASLAAFVGYGVITSRSAIATGKGDLRRVTLAEGSAVTLNTDSRIHPRIAEGLREVELVEGEALFDVTRDPKRPFIVHAGNARVRVLGTSFTVRRFDDDSVEITVFEGLVEVGDAGSLPHQLLRAGQRTRLFARGGFRTDRLPSEALERSVEWRRGLLDLDGMTLGEAAAEYARYSERRIEIAEPAIDRLKVTGVYSTSDPLGFAEAAALSLGLRAVPTAEGVQLRRP